MIDLTQDSPVPPPRKPLQRLQHHTNVQLSSDDDDDEVDLFDVAGTQRPEPARKAVKSTTSSRAGIKKAGGTSQTATKSKLPAPVVHVDNENEEDDDEEEEEDDVFIEAPMRPNGKASSKKAAGTTGIAGKTKAIDHVVALIKDDFLTTPFGIQLCQEFESRAVDSMDKDKDNKEKNFHFIRETANISSSSSSSSSASSAGLTGLIRYAHVVEHLPVQPRKGSAKAIAAAATATTMDESDDLISSSTRHVKAEIHTGHRTMQTKEKTVLDYACVVVDSAQYIRWALEGHPSTISSSTLSSSSSSSSSSSASASASPREYRSLLREMDRIQSAIASQCPPHSKVDNIPYYGHAPLHTLSHPSYQPTRSSPNINPPTHFTYHTTLTLLPFISTQPLTLHFNLVLLYTHTPSLSVVSGLCRS